MKITSRQYAQGLFEAVSGRTEAQAKAALKKFVALLGRDRALGRAAEIMAAFAEIWDRENGILAAELVSARKLGAAAKQPIIDFLKKRTNAGEVSLSETIDESLLGGFILRYESRVIDGSLKSSLQDLKNKISN